MSSSDPANGPPTKSAAGPASRKAQRTGATGPLALRSHRSDHLARVPAAAPMPRPRGVRRPGPTVAPQATGPAGAVRLLKDFYAVAGPALTHPWDANAYLVAGEVPTLIDCGSAEGYPRLRQNLAGLGYAPSDIQRVIVTHGHWDHLSAMAELRRESRAQLLLHPGDRDAVESGDADRTAAFLYDRSFPAMEVDGSLEDGMTIQAGQLHLRVLHTPGHTPGSVCFTTEVDGLRLLITGDTVWGAFHERMGSDMAAWRRSLDRLLELEFEAMTIGHSLPALIAEGRKNLLKARQQFGVLFDPWFMPFHLRTR